MTMMGRVYLVPLLWWWWTATAFVVGPESRKRVWWECNDVSAARRRRDAVTASLSAVNIPSTTGRVFGRKELVMNVEKTLLEQQQQLLEAQQYLVALNTLEQQQQQEEDEQVPSQLDNDALSLSPAQRLAAQRNHGMEQSRRTRRLETAAFVQATTTAALLKRCQVELSWLVSEPSLLQQQQQQQDDGSAVSSSLDHAAALVQQRQEQLQTRLRRAHCELKLLRTERSLLLAAAQLEVVLEARHELQHDRDDDTTRRRIDLVEHQLAQARRELHKLRLERDLLHANLFLQALATRKTDARHAVMFQLMRVLYSTRHEQRILRNERALIRQQVLHDFAAQLEHQGQTRVHRERDILQRLAQADDEQRELVAQVEHTQAQAVADALATAQHDASPQQRIEAAARNATMARHERRLGAGHDYLATLSRVKQSAMVMHRAQLDQLAALQGI